jgi:MoaA/NifB/PqqE/SkfB family radical SAM enzyme
MSICETALYRPAGAYDDIGWCRDTVSGGSPVGEVGKGGAEHGEDIHMGEPGLLHKLFRRKKLESLFLFVTSRCNSRCRTCFYHEKLNDGGDLSFEEIRKISETAPRFDKLWLSGGEPTLREDLVEIIEHFYKNNGVRVLNFPSNGLLEDRVDRMVSGILDSCPDLTIHLNFSLDGLGETHDRIRGVPRNFKKTIRSMERIRSRYRDNPRLLQNVATVVTPEAYHGMLDLGAYLLEKDLVSTHFFEVLRGDPRDPLTKRIDPAKLASLHEEILPLFRTQAERLFAGFAPLVRGFARMYFLGFIKFVLEIQEANLNGPSDWGMDCTAGKTTFVVDHDGSFRSCEMRPPVGRLQDYGFNLRDALDSKAMRKEVADIGGGRRANCWCTHSCWIMSSMKFSPVTLLFRIPAAHRRFREKCASASSLPEVNIHRIESY